MTCSQFMRLVRPRTLTAAISPVLIGASFGATTYPLIHPLWLSLLYTFAILLCVVTAQMAVNIWNEYFDYLSGLDAKQVIGNSGSITREGIAPSAIKRAGICCLVIPAVLGIFLAASVAWWYLPVGALCILVGYLYSGGPFPLSRTPLGEIASGLSMGFAIVLITIVAWSGQITWKFLIPAIPSTILIGTIMMTNNLRDMNNDADHGRRTLVILLGRDGGILLLGGLFAVAIAWTAFWVFTGELLPGALLAAIAMIPAKKAIQIFNTYADPVHLDQAMKFSCIGTTLYHVAFSLGILINAALAPSLAKFF